MRKYNFGFQKELRWDYIKDNAKDPKIGQYIDAMILIEKENANSKKV